MKNRHEFHARKGDAKMVDNEHPLGSKSDKHVGVLNFPVRFRCQFGVKKYLRHSTFSTLLSHRVFWRSLGSFGLPLVSLWFHFGRFGYPFW